MEVSENPTIMLLNEMDGGLMIRKFIVAYLISLSGLSCASQPETDMPCWMSGDYSQMITSQEAMLKTYLLPINLDAPEVDAKVRIRHGDYRLIGIGGLGIRYPGLDKKSQGNVLCRLGGRYIQGTSDAQEGESHAMLNTKFLEYAESYNAYVMRHKSTFRIIKGHP
jgi:hypothetical protein